MRYRNGWSFGQLWLDTTAVVAGLLPLLLLKLAPLALELLFTMTTSGPAYAS